MADWLTKQLFSLAVVGGGFVFFFLVFLTLNAIWTLFKKQHFEYFDTWSGKPIPWWGHLGLWIWSIYGVAAMTQMPNEEDVIWSLYGFSYHEFLESLDFSLLFHAVMAVIIVVRLHFNAPMDK